MSYSSQTVVSNAWYLATYDRNLQKTIQGGDMLFGLEQMQFILDEWRDLVPYTEKYIFTNVDQLVNTVFVNIDNLAYVFPNGNVKYLIEGTSNQKFEEANNVIGLQAIPYIYWFDPLKQTINVYPSPNQTGYQFIVYGRPGMVVGSLYVPMPTNMPTYMINALQYELAYRLCGSKGAEFDEKKNEIRIKLLGQLESKREVDLSPSCGTEMTNQGSSVPPYPIWWEISGGRG